MIEITHSLSSTLFHSLTLSLFHSFTFSLSHAVRTVSYQEDAVQAADCGGQSRGFESLGDHCVDWPTSHQALLERQGATHSLTHSLTTSYRHHSQVSIKTCFIVPLSHTKLHISNPGDRNILQIYHFIHSEPVHYTILALLLVDVFTVSSCSCSDVLV
jgi:hypothetical protein